MTSPPHPRAVLSASRVWEYRAADGDLEFLVCRWDATPPPNEKPKRFAQYSVHPDAAGNPVWVAKAPPSARADGSRYLRPLLGLPALLVDPDAPVLVVEGEKTRDAASQYLPPGWLVTTWAGGTNAVQNTDWTPLRDRLTVIWPDWDLKYHPPEHKHAGDLLPFDDQPGKKAALKIAALTGGRIVALPETVAHEWDLADPLPDGLTPDDVTAMILEAAESPAAAEPAATEPAGRAGKNPAPAAVPDDVPRETSSKTAAKSTALAEIIPPHVLTGPPPPDDRAHKLNGHDIDIPADYFRTDTGKIKPLFANVVIMLRKNPGRWNLRYDEFSQRPVSGETPLTDGHLRRISEWVQYEGLPAGTRIIDEAVMRAAELDRFHPVREYLDGLVWDNIPRIDFLLIDHAGAHDDDHGLTRAFTAKWLVQAVARIYEPGCHARATLVLEGPQDIGKSTIYRELFGDRWFTDHLPDIANKDALLQLRGTWCVEIAELATLGRSDTARIKQFLTSRVDRYRDPYGRLVADYPRTCVFGGTVNPGARGYLKDETGGTRFWPIAVSKIDIGAFRALRDQIWAEAVVRFRSGEQWHLDASMLAAARDTQSSRYEGDPWGEKIADFVRGRTETTTSEVFRLCLNMTDESDWTQGDMNRIGRALSDLDWTRTQRREGKRRRSVYVAPAETDDKADEPELKF